MPARRFFVEGIFADGDRVVIDPADAHKIVNVLRMADGGLIDVVDSGGTHFAGVLERNGGEVFARLRDGRQRGDGAALRISIAQALPKGAKMDFVVEKLSELGVAEILPFTASRTVGREPGEAKVKRWRRLARSATQQSGGSSVPRIPGVTDFAALLQGFGRYDRVLVPWESADLVSPRAALPGLIPDSSGSVLALIGPEGGFSHEEVDAAVSAGATVISLGERILRTETAGIVLTAILRFLSS